MRRGPDLVRVVTSTQSAAHDAATIARGVPARALMNRAGAAAAGEIARRFSGQLSRGVLVLAGPGNNGGDAWVIARALATRGIRVRVTEPAGAKSPDCVAERALAIPCVELVPFTTGQPIYDGEGVVVDGLLGTGAEGPPRGDIAACLRAVAHVRERGAALIAIDLPTGLNASSGDGNGVLGADLTITFGSIKRGHLVARELCGRIVVADIGLIPGEGEATHCLVDESWLHRMLPPISARAHKGTRKKVVIVGGDRGMAGAVILAVRAAHRSGVGMVRAVVHEESLAAVQQAEPAALASTWNEVLDDMERTIVSWADAVVIGPGLGMSGDASNVLSRVLSAWRGPAVLDADALNAFAGDLDRLAAAIGARKALLTPHPAELGRLMGRSVDDVLASRFEIGGELAIRSGATVLVKGVPTIIADGVRPALVSAAGTPVLAAAASGDILSGIAGTMLGQLGDPRNAGAAAALVHGRAAELAGDALRMLAWSDQPEDHLDTMALAREGDDVATGATIRGTTLDDVVEALREAWMTAESLTTYPVITELPSVGSR